MKKLMFILLGCLIINISFSQTEKETIAIDLFEWGPNVDNAIGDGVQDAVINGFIKEGRFNVIDKDRLGFVHSEQNRQMSENAINAENAKRQAKMKELGADYIITGKVTGYAANKEEKTAKIIGGGTKTYTEYSINLQFTLNALASTDGSVVGTEIISETGISDQSISDAVLKVLKSFDYEVELFIQKYFPLEVKIVEISNQKKGKAKEVLIAGGEILGLKKGDKFKVVEISMLGGMKREKEIGKITIKTVEGDNFSKCKVNDGGEELFKKFNEEKTLICISLQDSGAKKFVKGLGI